MELSNFCTALMDQEGKVNMRLDVLEDKTRKFSEFRGSMKGALDSLLKRVEDLKESKALLEGQVKSLVNQVCCCGEVPVIMEEDRE